MISKRLLGFLAWGILFCNLAMAQPIEPKTAQQVAENLFKSMGLTAAPELVVLRRELPVGKSDNPYFIFNASGPEDGFVIISADRRAFPLIAYSTTSDFYPDNVPINMRKWMEGYRKEIQYVIKHNLPATSEIVMSWKEHVEGRSGSQMRTAAVAPLVATKWNQSPFYNDLCPYDYGYGERAVTGCVAAAMAQIMRYWKYPSQGSGYHSYVHTLYGSQSANFGITTYDWNNMPLTLSGPNQAVAVLMQHCGISVDMNYGVASTGGSGAYVIGSGPTSETALKTYFKYASTLKGISRSSYSTTNWLALLKAELDAGRPILHTGFGSGGGHAFVCDGYDNSNFLHFNWGWGGISDGYFRNDQLNPGSLGAGGGLGGFNSDQQAIVGIQPPGGIPPATEPALELYSGITLTPTTVIHKQPFTVQFNLVNKASASFVGTYGALLFDSQNKLIAELGTYSETTGLLPNQRYTSNLSFNVTNLEAVPGSYTVGIYYKKPGATAWSLVKPGAFQSHVPLSIVAGNNIAMYAPFQLFPPVMVQGKECVIKLNVRSFSETFQGDISVDLHDEEGNWIQEIGVYYNLSMCANCYFTDGLVYVTNGLNLPPGTYQLALWAKPVGKGWKLVESSAEGANPFAFVLSEPPIPKDIFEDNNTEVTAKALGQFVSDTLRISTVGANSHLGNDYDYYKITFPPVTGQGGYLIEARAQDSYNSDDGNTYTNDVLWSYKVNNGD